MLKILTESLSAAHTQGKLFFKIVKISPRHLCIRRTKVRTMQATSVNYSHIQLEYIASEANC